MIVEINGKKYEGEPKYNVDLAVALEDSQSDGYTPLFMPELADQRIKANKDSVFWKKWFTTPSLRATGTTNQGSKVVVYRHKENHLSNPDNIREAKRKGLIKYAAIIPQTEFQKYVDEDGQTNDKGNRLVWVVDYEKLKNSFSGVIPVDSALDHPQTIPFLGGEERAIAYLKKHKEIFGNNIGIRHSDDLFDEPIGRLLYLGDGFGGGLYGDISLDDDSQFFGVREVGAEGAGQKTPAEVQKQKLVAPTLEQILKFANPFVPEKIRKEFEDGLKRLYNLI